MSIAEGNRQALGWARQGSHWLSRDTDHLEPASAP
jgi:hypothetical protein